MYDSDKRTSLPAGSLFKMTNVKKVLQQRSWSWVIVGSIQWPYAQKAEKVSTILKPPKLFSFVHWGPLLLNVLSQWLQ